MNFSEGPTEWCLVFGVCLYYLCYELIQLKESSVISIFEEIFYNEIEELNCKRNA